MAQAGIIDPIDPLERAGPELTEHRKVQAQTRQRAPDITVAGRGVVAEIEAAQVFELGGEPVGKANILCRPDLGDSLLRVGYEALDQFGHQPALVAEVVMDVGARCAGGLR